jgi:hypothetical protein
MKTYKKILIVVAALMLMVPMAVPASAQAIKVNYSGSECPISAWGEPERYWVEGNIVHARGVTTALELVAGNEYVDGINYVLMNYDVNTLTGEVHVYGTAKLVPHAYDDGYYEGRFSSHWWGLEGWRTAVFHGEGELDGITVTNEGYAMDMFGCDYFTGTILIP